MIPYGYAPLPWWARLVLRLAFFAGDCLHYVRMTWECVRFGLGSWLGGVGSMLWAGLRWLGRFPW